jgi:hypothetical protein
MHIITGQAIGRQDHHGIELAAPGGVTQPIQGRAIQPGPADPVIEVLMRWQQGPALVLHMVLERAPLTLDRAVLLLLTGRDSCIQGYVHPGPPDVPA